MRSKSTDLLLRSFAVSAAAALGMGVAHAQPNKSYVSGTGSDSNNCSVSAPCQTLQRALGRTKAGGQIFALDSANFGYLTIKKSIWIGGSGATGVLANAGVPGITIAAGAADKIVLQGVHVDAAGSGNDGISFQSGGSLEVRDSVVRAARNGIRFETSAQSSLVVVNSLLQGDSYGLSFKGSSKATAALTEVQAISNGTGILAAGVSATEKATLSLQKGVVSNNGTGISVNNFAVVTVSDSTISGNNVGLAASGDSATLTISQSTVTGNTTASTTSGGAQITSTGNATAGNDVVVAPTDPTPAPAPAPTEPPAPTVLAKNIVTDFGAKCDGVTDDGANFMAFNTWAVANQGTPPTPIVLNIPSGSVCHISPLGGGRRFAKNIKRLTVIGYGATLTNKNSQWPGFFLGGDGQQDLNGEHNFSAKIATVPAGATSVSVLDKSKLPLFEAGRWVLISGFDMQALWYSSYGYPSNPAFHDYVKITSIDRESGVVAFEQPLKYTYKSTWPEISIDEPGPATMSQLPASWDTEVEYRGLTIEQLLGTKADGRSVTFRDVTFTGNHGGYPTQNMVWTAINVTCTTCLNEVDKMIDIINISNSTWGTISVQSSSVGTINLSSVTLNSIKGTPKRLVGYKLVVADFRPGTAGYGRTDEIICSECDLGSQTFTGSYVMERGYGDKGVNNIYSMSDGIIRIPNGQRIIGVSDNGAGKVRLTVPTTAGFTTGKWMHLQGMRFDSTDTTIGDYQIVVVDSTHVDLPGLNMPSGTYNTANPGLIHAGNPGRWAIPNTNLFWFGQQQNAGAFHVVDVYQDVHSIYVKTNLTSGFPNIRLDSSGRLGIAVHPAPKWTCTCTGHPEIVAQAGAKPGLPIFSYYKVDFDGSANPYFTTKWPRLWGTLSTLAVDVRTPYSGTEALTFYPFSNLVAYQSDGTEVNYNPSANAKIASSRQMTLTGVTGLQSGDAIPLPSSPIWFTGTPNTPPRFSVNISATPPSIWPSIIVEMSSQQSLVGP
jgi:hypothetical protein